MKDKKETFDVIIAGGGLAGCLVAARLASSKPQAKLALFEKSFVFGGRALGVSWQDKFWGCGMNSLSNKLSEFIKNTIASCDLSGEIYADSSSLSSDVQVLSGGRLTSLESRSILTLKGTKALLAIGKAAPKWQDFESCLAGDEKSHLSLEKALDLKKNKAWQPLLKAWGALLGVAECNKASSNILKDRLEYICSLKESFSQLDFLGDLLCAPSQQVEKYLDNPILSCTKEDQFWLIESKQGSFSTKNLIVAQTPWDAYVWLDKKYFPKPILDIASRSKPISLVTLAKKNLSSSDNSIDLHEHYLILSELVHVRKINESLLFSIEIDYENSLDAPSVLKAIKSLRRSVKKICNFFPQLILESEHISLNHVGWPQSGIAKDHNLVKNIKTEFSKEKSLYFCGDAYGTSYNPDENLMQSVLSVASVLNNQLT